MFSWSPILKKSAVLLCLIFTSCLAPDISNWPKNIPPERSFDEVYLDDSENQQLQLREEYLEWILSFYEGNLAYPSGWLGVEAIVLNSISTEEARPMARQLSQLGYSIGAEWAKHNRLRLIDSRMLALWGSALQMAENIQHQTQSIELISTDVEEILSGRMSKSDIDEARYEELLKIDFFDGF